MPGDVALVSRLRAAFDEGRGDPFEQCALDGETSEHVHAVASLLKLFLRELPSPLVPVECFAPLLDAGAAASAAAYAAPSTTTSAAATKKAQPGDQQIIRILTRAPGIRSRDNRVSLRFLLQFLNRVTSSSDTMGAKNLAICFAPTVMRRTVDQDSAAAVDPTTQVRLEMSFIYRVTDDDAKPFFSRDLYHDFNLTCKLRSHFVMRLTTFS